MEEFEKGVRRETEGQPLSPKELGINESMLGAGGSEYKGAYKVRKDEERKDDSPKQDEREKGSKVWGGVTDPSHHNPDRYRYLVHAFNPFAKLTMPLAQLTAHRDGIMDATDKSHGDQSIDLFRQPDRLNERVSLSTSLIDQDHHGTWGSIGLILEAPEDNIVITASSDVGSLNASPDFLRQQAESHRHMSGDQLLQQTPPTSYNEVVALAKTGQGDLKLKGFFAKVDEEGYLDEKSAQTLKYQAQRLGLPFVEIIEPSQFGEDKYEVQSEVRYAHYKGKRYNLGGGKENPKYDWQDNTRHAFNNYTSRGESFFTSPEELEEVLGFVAEQNPNKPELIEKIRQEYKEAHERYLAPKLNYDDEGTLQTISMRHGYGKDAWEYRITRSGYSYDTNLQEQSKNMREQMMNMGQMTMIGLDREKWWERQIYTDTTDGAVEEALKYADPETAEAARAFYDEVRPKIESMYRPPSRDRFSGLATIDPGEIIPESKKVAMEISDFDSVISELHGKPKKQPSTGDEPKE